MDTRRQLRSTLDAINWSYGKGDITHVGDDGYVLRHMPYAGDDKRKYTLSADGRKVTFLRHTRRIAQ
ncbi:hypothetical protein M0R72_08855 [Candidatus Pacearchaeota archaeon]|jgi:hypothetical protein|nr:hypothetical protein [Candidatus Pacearchaeota archaeon]